MAGLGRKRDGRAGWKAARPLLHRRGAEADRYAPTGSAERGRGGNADAGEARILEGSRCADGISPAGGEGHNDEEGERSRKGPEPESPGQCREETPTMGSETARIRHASRKPY